LDNLLWEKVVKEDFRLGETRMRAFPVDKYLYRSKIRLFSEMVQLKPGGDLGKSKIVNSEGEKK